MAIDTAQPASTVATQGEALEIRGQVRAQGSKPASRVVEFYLDGVKKGQKAVELPPGGQAPVSFLTPPRLSEGEIHRGELKLSGTPDPLEFNDSRFFTFKVRPPLKVLLISDLTLDAEFVAAALAPDPTAVGDQRLPGEQRSVRPSSWPSTATRSAIMRRSSCSTSRLSTRTPGACSTATCTRGAGW